MRRHKWVLELQLFTWPFLERSGRLFVRHKGSNIKTVSSWFHAASLEHYLYPVRGTSSATHTCKSKWISLKYCWTFAQVREGGFAFFSPQSRRENILPFGERWVRETIHVTCNIRVREVSGQTGTRGHEESECMLNRMKGYSCSYLYILESVILIASSSSCSCVSETSVKTTLHTVSGEETRWYSCNGEVSEVGQCSSKWNIIFLPIRSLVYIALCDSDVSMTARVQRLHPLQNVKDAPSWAIKRDERTVSSLWRKRSTS